MKAATKVQKKRSRARHKKRDIILVKRELDPYSVQERIMTDCLRRLIVGENADLVLSTCPLDTIFARNVTSSKGVIFTTDHHKAGEWFLRLVRYHAPGRCRLRGTLDTGQHSNDTNVEDPHRDAEYLALTTDDRLSRRGLNSLMDIIVFGISPPWLINMIDGSNNTSYDNWELDCFIETMDVVKTIWIEFGGKTTQFLHDKHVRQASRYLRGYDTIAT